MPRSAQAGKPTEREEHRNNTLSHLRVPPQSAEAEQAVLGGLMLSPTALPVVQGIINEGDFYRRDHRLIYRAILELEEKARPFDAVTMGEWFEAQGMAELVAGGAYLIDLASNTPSAANIAAYAEIVRDKAVLRQLVDIGTEVTNNAFDPQGRDTDELIAEATAKIESVVRTAGSVGASARDVLKVVNLEMQEAFYADENHRPGLSTGNEELDKKIGYLRPARVYGVGGRPKMGKSTLAGDIAVANALAGVPVDVFTYEMPAKEMMQIFMAKVGSIDYHLLQHPKLMQDDDWGKVKNAFARLRDTKLTIHDDASTTIERIWAVCQVKKAKGELGLVVIDQLNIMPTPDLGRRDLELGHITRMTKRMAVRLGVPVILVFQLNRGNEAGGKVRPPRAGDARDSGAIEQDLDAMILLHRPSYYDKSAPKGCRLEVALQRNGESGVVIRLEDELQYSRFAKGRSEWVDTRSFSVEDSDANGF
jgi:replicative DNA helicase